MSGKINSGLFSSEKETWGTPQVVFDLLDAEFGFDLDAAALPSSAKCKKYYTPEDDALTKTWEGCVFLNPPYGRTIGEWVAHARKQATRVVCLLPVRCDTRWWHEHVMKASEIRLLTRRLSFEGGDNKAPMPCAIVVFEKEDRTPILSAFEVPKT